MQYTARVDKSGRFVIPKELREEFGIQVNSEVYIEVERGYMRLAPTAEALDTLNEYQAAHLLMTGPDVIVKMAKKRKLPVTRRDGKWIFSRQQILTWLGSFGREWSLQFFSEPIS